MNVFTIEATHGKYAVMETLMKYFPNYRCTADKDNVAFIINDCIVLYPRRSFHLGWNESISPEELANGICDRAFAEGYKNIFIYTNERRNSILVVGLIYSFKVHNVPDDFQNVIGCGNVFIFCQPF